MTGDKPEPDESEEEGEIGRRIGRARRMAEEALKKAEEAKREADYIPEAIITVALAAFQILDTKSWGLPENVKVWVTFAGLAFLLVLILRRRIIAPFLRKILHRPPREGR